MNLKGRDFLTLRDFTGEEIQYIVDLGLDLKDKLKKGIPHPYLQGKSLAMIFQKSSTRTRVSFEVGMYQLGGQALFLSTRDLQIGRGEPVQDTARVLSRYVDGILIRTYEQAEVEAFAKYADVPVINGHLPPNADHRRSDHDQGAEGASRWSQFLLCRRRQQHGSFADDRHAQVRSQCGHRNAGRLPAGCGDHGLRQGHHCRKRL